MGNSGDTILPFHTCKRNMASDFSAFFYNKILNIRSELRLRGTHTGGSVTNNFSGVPLNTFMEVVFTSKYKHDLYNDLSITIGGTVVDCSSQVRDLGVIFDRVLSLRQHVSYTSKTCRFHLRKISRIRKK